MNLIEESFQNKEERKRKRVGKIILVAIILIVISIIAIISYLMYLKDMKVIVENTTTNQKHKVNAIYKIKQKQ